MDKIGKLTAAQDQRLVEFREEDAKAEGIAHWPPGTLGRFSASYGLGPHGNNYTHAFALLWQSINGSGSWEANPWCACYSFERVKS